MDEWFNIVQDQVGTDGQLYNYAPANAVLESMRKSANEKAKVVQQERNSAEFMRQQNMDKTIEGAISEMFQQGRSDAEVVADIAEKFGPDQAKRFAGRAGAIKQRIEIGNITDGYRIGDGFDSVEAAQEFVNSKPDLQQGLKDAIIARAKKNQEKMEIDDQKEYAGVIAKLEPFAFTDNAASRDYIKSQLPFRMTRSEADVSRHVDAAMKAWKSRAEGAEAIYSQDVRAKSAGAVIGLAPDAYRADREQGLLQARLDAATLENANKAPEQALQARAAEIKQMFDSRPSNKLKHPALRESAKAFITEYAVLDADAIVAAAEQGPEAFAAAKAAAMKTAVPAATVARRAGREAMIRIGAGFSGDPAKGEEEYMAMLKAGEADVVADATRAGKMVADEVRKWSGDPARLKAGMEAAAANISSEVLRTRALLTQSGKFGITAMGLGVGESAAVVKQVIAFAKAAGLDGEQSMALYQKTMGMLGDRTDISPQMNAQQKARAQDNQMRAGFGLPSLFPGAPGPGQGTFYRPPFGAAPSTGPGYRPPSDPNSPF
jgi:hypothetical protein